MTPKFGFSVRAIKVPDREVGVGQIPALEVFFADGNSITLVPDSIEVFTTGPKVVEQFLEYAADRLMGRK